MLSLASLSLSDLGLIIMIIMITGHSISFHSFIRIAALFNPIHVCTERLSGRIENEKISQSEDVPGYRIFHFHEEVANLLVAFEWCLKTSNS